MKIVSASEAVSMIGDNNCVGISAFGGWLGTDSLYTALAERYNSTGHPANLTLYGGIFPGAMDNNKVGANILAIKGMIGKVYCSHIGLAPIFSKFVLEDKVPAFAYPLGVFTKLLRTSSSKEPGLISKIGLNGFCDPDIEGCSLNKLAKSEIKPVSRIYIENQSFLYYKAFALDVCFIRASSADSNGNLSMLNEPLIGDQLEMALATKANGGTVIAEVRDFNPKGTFRPRDISIHSNFVDYIVISKSNNADYGYGCREFRRDLIEKVKDPGKYIMPINKGYREIIARRSTEEIKPGVVVNLGIGIPEGIATCSFEDGSCKNFLLSLESGLLGGIPIGGVSFGASVGPEAFNKISDTFDLYDGGGLDMAFLGAGEIDSEGNVNVSKFSGKLTGPGGFINIAQSTKNVFFLSSFTAEGLRTDTKDFKLRIVNEGNKVKFKENVEQITFSAKMALLQKQKVKYITERAVFELTDKGIVLTEIAPGVDLKTDILEKMEFAPIVSPDLKIMNQIYFN